MRVLVVHNRYSSRVPSGENLAVDDEVRWLRDAGVEVDRHEVSNDDLVSPTVWSSLRNGASAVWSPRARRRFLAAVDGRNPDVVHIHNLFPLLSASVPQAARRRRIPVVWTVHNRRVRCVAGGNFRDGNPCHECTPGWRAPGVVHRCYAGSTVGSAVVTASSSIFGTIARRPGALTAVAISREVARWLVTEGGFRSSDVVTKYNGVAGPLAPPPPPGTAGAFAFVGRLSAYKGVALLLEAWKLADVDARLTIVGDGEMDDEVRAAAARDRRITVVGGVPANEVSNHLAAARAVIVPSTWIEPYGRTSAEAMAHGRPVITTGTGGLAEIVDEACGWRTGISATAMADAIRAAAASDAEVDRRGRAAAERHARLFSPEATTRALVDVYRSALTGPTGDEAASAEPGT